MNLLNTLVTEQNKRFTTRDGRQVHIRHLLDNDTALLVDFFHHLSDETKKLRFHANPNNLPEERIWQEAENLSHLDPDCQVALVAVIEEDGVERAVGVARYCRNAPADTEAEAAIVIRDDYQSVGLGKHLMWELAEAGRSMGIKAFSAWVMAENRRLFRMISQTPFPLKRETSHGETHVVATIG